MKAFATLYSRLDATTSSNAKLAAMRNYFREADPADAAWAVYFLAGGRPRQLVPTRVLRETAMQASGLPEWLFEESYQAVGDMAETISLLMPEAEHSSGTGSPCGCRTNCCPCAVCRRKNWLSDCPHSGHSWIGSA